MSEFRIASRYAKSLLELAEEKNSLDGVRDDMKSFEDLCNTNHDFVLMLKNPIVGSFKKLAIIKEIFDGKVNELSSAIFEIITKKKREMYLPEVAVAFREQYYLYKGIVESTVTTVIPLSAAMKQDVSAIVKKITKTDVVLTELIDPNLIGGFVLKIGDKQIDDSVSSKLRALRLQFSDNSYANTV